MQQAGIRRGTTWPWNNSDAMKSLMWDVAVLEGAEGAAKGEHPKVGNNLLCGRHAARRPLTENESKSELLECEAVARFISRTHRIGVLWPAKRRPQTRQITRIRDRIIGPRVRVHGGDQTDSRQSNLD
jgi:hypothetical protein